VRAGGCGEGNGGAPQTLSDSPSLTPPPSPLILPPPRRTKYHLKDVVTGRVDFLLVRIKIKHMEVALIRREAAGFRA
jgi:hypothetical protein